MSVIMSGIATHVCFGAAEETTAQFFSRKAGKVRKRMMRFPPHTIHSKGADKISFIPL